MRKPVLLILLVLCAGCSPLPYLAVPDAPRPQARAVVFDIDGTLTPDVSSVFTARPDAAAAVRAYAEKGYGIIYVTTRVAWLSRGLPDWLGKQGFPAGNLHVAQTHGERADPDAYKTGILKGYLARGWQLSYAYGDSSTDLAAYANSGIPPEHVFALLRKGEASCQPGIAAACLDGWTGHLRFVATSVAHATVGGASD